MNLNLYNGCVFCRVHNVHVRMKKKKRPLHLLSEHLLNKGVYHSTLTKCDEILDVQIHINPEVHN